MHTIFYRGVCQLSYHLFTRKIHAREQTLALGCMQACSECTPSRAFFSPFSCAPYPVRLENCVPASMSVWLIYSCVPRISIYFRLCGCVWRLVEADIVIGAVLNNATHEKSGQSAVGQNRVPATL